MRKRSVGTRARLSAPARAFPRGARCRAAIPHCHWQTTTLVAAPRLEGMTAPMVIHGALNGEAFRAYVRHMLALSIGPGDVVVMDNLPAHKVGGGPRDDRGGQRAAALPPAHPPDFNPIEQAFAKLKAFLRKAAARTLDALETAIAAALDAFAPDTNAPTTSPPRDTNRNERNLLRV